MKFKNRSNVSHKIKGGIIWESRSIAVMGIIVLQSSDGAQHVLIEKRGPNAADFKGRICLPCGYLDFDENGTEAIYREIWEEVGFDVRKYMTKHEVLINAMNKPWGVNTNPTANKQNVTIYFAALIKLSENEKLPKLTTKYNEVEGEIEDPIWMPLADIDKYQWAFRHNKTLLRFLELTKKKLNGK